MARDEKSPTLLWQWSKRAGMDPQEPVPAVPVGRRRMTTRFENAAPDPLEAFFKEAPAGPSAEVPADEGAGKASVEVEPTGEASSETPVERVTAVVMKQPLDREILYKTLGFCRERRALTDIEEEIASYPEFQYATQNQYRLISFLADAGGLDLFELDDGGEIVTDERKAGLSEDEIDDLVASYAYLTTAAGEAAHEQLAPRKRMLELLDTTPEHAGTITAILEFCTSSRTYEEIEDLLAGSSTVSSGTSPEEAAVHPSYFVSNLERVGAVVWNDGWLLSDEGRVILEHQEEIASSKS